jgi:diguanylate cyclase (GGDEF)-like protein
MKNFSMRAQLMLLVVLSALPALGVALYGAFNDRHTAEARARGEIVRLAKLAASQQSQLVAGARQMLAATSRVYPVLQSDPGTCQKYFAAVLQESAGLYHSMGLHSPDGDLFCNAVSWQGSVNVADRLYFRLARQSRAFSVGAYQVGRATGLPGLNFGYPVSDDNYNLQAIAFAALDLNALNRLAQTTPLPYRGILTVIDVSGTILARYPETGASRVGQKLQNDQAMQQLLANPRGGTFELVGTDKLLRLFAYEPVYENADGSIAMRVMISIPVSVVFAEANRALMRNVTATAIATVLLLVGAWFGGDYFIRRKIRNLLAAASRVQRGDFGSRTGIAHGRDELGQLGAAFDDMSAALQQRDAELKRALADLSEQATTDVLTGLANRRYLNQALARDLLRAQRRGAPVAAVVLDLDYFKRVNDTFGHETGDVVLRELGRILKASVRGSDVACRLGGEEFALILPDASLDVALGRAEAVRVAMKAVDLEAGGQKIGPITLSAGVAVFPQHAGDAEGLLRAADQALYEAKGSGRDRVVSWREEFTRKSAATTESA